MPIYQPAKEHKVRREKESIGHYTDLVKFMLGGLIMARFGRHNKFIKFICNKNTEIFVKPEGVFEIYYIKNPRVWVSFVFRKGRETVTNLAQVGRVHVQRVD